MKYSKYLRYFSNQLLIAILISQFVALPNYSFAQTRNAHSNDPVIDALKKSSILEKGSEPSALAQENANLTEAILNHDLSKYPQQYLKNFNLIKQGVLPAGENSHFIPFINSVEAVPSVAIESINPIIIDNQVHLQGINNNEVIASHIITGIDAIAIAEDPELIIIVDRKGIIHAIDKVYMVGEVFKAPIPVFEISATIPNFNLNDIKDITISFLTRGTKPFNEVELANIVQEGKALLPVNLKNEVNFNSGDIVIYNNKANREFLGVYSRPMTHTIIERGTKYLTLLEFLYSHEGYGETFAEKQEKYLQIGNKITNPYKKVLELFDESEKKEFNEWRKELFNKGELNPEVAVFLSNTTREQLKHGIKASETASQKKKQLRDKFTYKQWLASYEKLNQQAKEEVKQIKLEISNARKHQNNFIKKNIASAKKHIEELDETAESLKKQINSGNFSNISHNQGKPSVDYQALIKARVNGNYAFSKKLLPWYKKLTGKKIAKITKRFAKITAATVGVAAGTSLYLYMKDGLLLGDQYKLLIDLYDASVFSLVRDNVAYYQTAIKGVVSLLAFIPAAYLFGQFLVPALEMAQKVLPNGSKVSKSLNKTIRSFKPLTPWQRNITLSMRAYSRLLLPYFHRVSKTFRQPTIPVMQLGLNPLKRVKIGDKRRFLGFVSPFKSKKKMVELNKQRAKVLTNLSIDANSKKTLAWSLATLAVASEEKIDPATLIAVADQSISLNMLENIQASPKTKKKWKLTATEFLNHLNKSSGKIDLSQLSTDDIQKYYSEVKKIAMRINKNSRLKNSLVKLKQSFKGLGVKVGKSLSLFGVEDYNFLNNIVASEFVAKQTTREFVSDHLIVATLPSVAGERASRSHLDLLAHEEGGMLWNSSQHMYDVANNTIAHLLMAGPSNALVYQKVSVENTTVYDPIDTYLLSKNVRPQGFFRAAATWTKGILDFKKSNIGGYYLKGFFRRFTTLQASLSFTIFARVLIGGQSVAVSLMAFAMTWFASTLVYGWPWTILSRGNQYLGENVAEKTSALKDIQSKIFNGLRNNDDPLVSEGYNEMLEFYQKNYQASKKPMLAELKKVSKAIDQKVSMKKLRSAMKSKNTKEVYGIIASAIASYEEGNTKAAKQSIKDAVSLKSSKYKSENINEHAHDLLQESLVRSPVHTVANSAWPNVTTFVFGAILTTYLAIGLMVDSFSPEKLTFANIGMWAGKLALFYPIVFALTSSHTWSKAGKSKMYKRFQKFKMGICNRTFQN